MKQEKRGRPAKAPAQMEALVALGQAVAAWMLGVGAQTLSTWPDAPRNADGSYNARDLVAWMLSKNSDDVESTGGATSANLEKYRAEKVRAAKRENEVAEGLLLVAADVDRMIAETMSALRVEFEGIGRVAGVEVADEIAKAIDRADAALDARFGGKA